ncbi:STAS domain-containing protein [Magnetospirillum fulvum]|uniref:Anti-anti-sigma regulatory factor (Antagonist of anti-sigma factor) n=1 Tax=Magnetospirillum fulvum TaxID=1082 RepID=A0A1H6HN69_MAGFU|nr:STAS domain-containing protein [Magnetospirillum fulvum]SEH35550.1 Anti-anti-sigma regulatory factor (antagonist of anti-sigma factor) [Magnetospirillum fulvum]
METKESQGRLDIELPEIVDLLAAGELREALLDALGQESGGEVVLKAERVARLSTAAIQVVLSAVPGFAEAARRLILDAPAPPVVEAFGRLGLNDQLQNMTRDLGERNG